MKAMRQMMAIMLMGLALVAAQVESSAQSRSKDGRKPAATTNRSKPAARPVRPDVKPGGQNSKPGGPATKPSGPASKPGGPAAKPSGPASKPGGPAAKPSGPASKPGGPAAKPAPKHRPGYKPAPRPAPKPAPKHRPGYKPAPRPPMRAPKPVIVVRPTYGSIIAANIASQLIRSSIRMATSPIYYSVEVNGFKLSHSYISANIDYFYQDGVFYIVDAYGQYRTIIPPTGALVEYLPEDYTTFRRSGELFYRVDDTVYALRLIDGQPLFEVLGQLR